MSTNVLEQEVREIIEETVRSNDTCHICNSHDDLESRKTGLSKRTVRRINIDVLGPNGIQVCEVCELKIVDFILGISVPEKGKIDHRNLPNSLHMIISDSSRK